MIFFFKFLYFLYLKYRNKMLIFNFFLTEKAMITHHLFLLKAASRKAMNTICYLMPKSCWPPYISE